MQYHHKDNSKTFDDICHRFIKSNIRWRIHGKNNSQFRCECFSGASIIIYDTVMLQMYLMVVIFYDNHLSIAFYLVTN